MLLVISLLCGMKLRQSSNVLLSAKDIIIRLPTNLLSVNVSILGCIMVCFLLASAYPLFRFARISLGKGAGKSTTTHDLVLTGVARCIAMSGGATRHTWGDVSSILLQNSQAITRYSNAF